MEMIMKIDIKIDNGIFDSLEEIIEDRPYHNNHHNNETCDGFFDCLGQFLDFFTSCFH